MEQNLKKKIKIQILTLAASILLVTVLIFSMTAAWFTNVAKTSNMAFQTESWGFDAEKITLAEGKIAIAPGTSGIVPLSIDNSDSTETVQIGVTISKTAVFEEEPIMVEEMQKRIFFYADTPKKYTFEEPLTGTLTDEGLTEVEVESESVSRVYLGGTTMESYGYKILPGQILTMSEEYSTDVPIKWEWVYDVTGYYFRGTVKEADGEAQTEAQLDVNEYLRPIEYNYKEAVYSSIEDKEVPHIPEKINGQSVLTFLSEFSKSDGYEGAISESEPKTCTIDGKVYYEIDVNSEGYGVWAYLCTLQEIEESTRYDTDLQNNEAILVESLITLTANNVPTETIIVDTEARLKDALVDTKVDIVQLSMDVLPTEPLTFTEGTKVLDLNGKTLSYDGSEDSYDLITVSEGASLVVTNGSIVGKSKATSFSSNFDSTAFCASGGKVILSGVKISGMDCAIDVADMSAEEAADSAIQISDCEFETSQVSLILQGNGSVTDAMTKVYIQNSKLSSKYHVAIVGQGNSVEGDERWGTELVAKDCEIYGYYGGYYQPQKNSSATFTNCKISGNTAVAVKGGNVNFYDCELIGTGEAGITSAALTGSGYTDTGDAVYVEAGYNWPASVNLWGDNQVSSEKAYAVEIIGAEGKGTGKVMIFGGIYKGELGSANWNEVGIFEIYGGKFENTVDETIRRYDLETPESVITENDETAPGVG